MLRTGLILIVAIGLLVAGCHGGAGEDVVSIAGGRVESDVSAGVVKACEAAKATLVEYQQNIVQYSSGETHGRIVAYTLTSQRIEIDVVGQGKGPSRISIRTSGQGGEQISLTLLKRIRQLV